MITRIAVVSALLASGIAAAQDVVVSSTNSPYVINATMTLNSVTLQSGGTLQIDGAATVTQPIAVVAGSTVVINSGTALDSLDITGTVAGTLVVNAPLTWDAAALSVTGRLTLNSAFTVNGNLTMGVNSFIDHTAGDPDFALNVTGTADLAGLTDVTGRGFASGQAVNVNIPAAGQRSGGSHGGRGGYTTPNALYDDPLNPTLLGAAGGYEDPGQLGGRGGGRVFITAGTLRLGGGIVANGASSSYQYGGAGAGGSVNLRATTLEGAGGIQARGAASTSGGGGGGGRIAIYATTNNWTGTASATGGSSGSYGAGALGTVVIGNQSTPLSIAIGGGYFRIGAGSTYTAITMLSGGELYIDSAATVTNPITVSSSSIVHLNSPAALDNLNLNPVVSGNLIVHVPLTWDQAALQVNGRLTLNNRFTINGNLTMGANSVMDHWAGDPDFDLSVTGTADLLGLVDVTGRGFATNEAINVNVPAAGQRSGGSHGGRGGYTGPNALYDDPLNPTLLGAAGGQEDPGQAGGRGGGRVSITAGTLRVGGGIVANGASSGYQYGGGGAGGSVLLRATTLEGGGGVSARGAASSSGGGGGGGRIAIYATNNNWTGTTSTTGGSSGSYGAGSLGTAVIGNSDSPPALTVGGGYFRINAASEYPSITLRSGGELHIDGDATVTNPITVSSGSIVHLNNSAALNNLDLNTTITGNLQVHAPTVWDAATMTVNGRLTLNAKLTLNGDLTMGANSVMDHSAGDNGFELEVTGLADLGGVVDVTGRGLATNEAINVNVPAAGTRSGGSHGGRGGYTTPNALYDDPDNPTMLGAAGGQEDPGQAGGRGGGKVSITAGTLRLGGGVIANGASSGYQYGGGGAGGTVLLRATTLEGGGGIQARGAASSSGGGGGGGRIAVYATTNTWTGTTSAAGGSSGSYGAGTAGTVVVGNTATPPAITVGGGYFRIDGTSSYPSITMLSGGELHIDGPATVTAPITLSSGSTIHLNNSAALDNLNINSTISGTLVVNQPVDWDAASMTVAGRLTLNDKFTVNGDLTVLTSGVIDHTAGDPGFDLVVTGTADIVGLIDANARGYANQQAINALIGPAGYRSGGSHGGRGGYTYANTVYGDQLLPNMMGAAGGYEDPGQAGGRGGGKISITAGTLRVGGGIFANGANSGYQYGGGGAGGSILIRASTLEGNGGIQARGASAGGGSGGGGRVAIYVGSNSWTGAVSTAGGTGGYGSGALGSSFMSNTATPPDITVGGGYYVPAPNSTFASITMLAGGQLYLNNAVTVAQPITVSAGAAVYLNSSAALSAATIGSVAGTLEVNAPITSTSTLAVSGLLEVNAPFSLNDLSVSGTARVDQALTLSNLSVQAGGVLTHTAGVDKMVIDASGTIALSPGSKIDLNGMGLATNQTLDPLTLLPTAGSGTGVGGSHGGSGGPNGAVAARATYGSQYQPVSLGAGASTNGTIVGGRGGGRVKLTSSSFVLGGQILANGANPGGAGGAVWIVTNALSGAGVVEVKGGNSQNGTAGGVTAGGGGRIAIEHETGSFNGLITAVPGSAYAPAVAAGLGSAWMRKGSNGALTVMNGSHELTDGESFSSLTLGGATSQLVLAGNALVNAPVAVPLGATVVVDDATGLNGIALADTIAGSLVLNAATTLTGTRTFSGKLVVNAPSNAGELNLTGSSVTTLDARLTTTGDVFLANGGVIRHSAQDRDFDLRVGRKLNVQTGATIDAKGLGLRGGNQGAFGCRGTTLDPTTFADIAGAAQFGGGSFGALGGGTTNALYGGTSNTEWPGSGGGCGVAAADYGGHGGGILRIQAQLLEVYGVIDASGGNTTTQAGAGSGGGIHIIAAELRGTGVIRANGGNSNTGNGGGGGRIHLEVATNTFTGTLTANGGASTTQPAAASSTPNVVNTTPTPVIVSTPRTVTALNAPYSYDTDGAPEAVGVSAVTWSLPTAPPGATINATTGVITWTPTTVGVFGFVLRASAASTNGDQPFQVEVRSAPSVTSTANTTAYMNTPYSYGTNDSLVVTGSAPLTFQATIAPNGNPNFSVDGSGKITWTPTAVGTHAACVRVTNIVGSYDHCFTVNVAAGTNAPDITSSPLTTSSIGASYTYQPVATGTAPLTWAFFQGASPSGATIDPATGLVSYTPTATGKETFCISATNSAGNDVQCWQVTITGTLIAPQIVSSCNALATVSRAYHYDADDKAEATGTQPITFSLVTGPNGMTVAADGTVTWAPDQPGGTSFTLKAQNPVGQTTQTCAVGVQTLDGQGPAVIIRDANLRAAVGIGYRYSFDGKIHASGDRPITFAKVAGPPSLNVDSLTGAVSWTPSASGTVDVTVRATNAAGTDTYVFAIDVVASPPTPPVASFTVTPSTGDAPLNIQLDGSSSSAEGGILAMSFALGDGSADRPGPTASHSYAACAGYLVRLRVTDTYGQVSVADKPVAVTCAGETPPSAKILAVMVETPGETSVTFSCDCKPGSGAIVAYQWSTTDGFFSDQPSGAHIFKPGSHALRLQIIDENGLAAVDEIPVYAFAADGKKPPTITASADPSVATAPATVKLTSDAVDPDGQIVQVKWRFSDGAETTERNPVRTYANPIVEKAVVEATDNDGLVATAIVEITISGANGAPPAFVSVPVEDMFAGQAYSYDKDGLPTLRGRGPFTFELTAAPEGAAVDPNNGQISWTAPFGKPGPVDFALKATSAAGSATQTWKVEVIDLAVPEPPAAPEGCGCNGVASMTPLLAVALLGVLRRKRRAGK